jgi:hypothetical protein
MVWSEIRQQLGAAIMAGLLTTHLASAQTRASADPRSAPATSPVPGSLLPVADLTLTYDSVWTDRPLLRAGHPSVNDDTTRLTAGMVSGATPARDNPPRPLTGKPWPTFGNYGSLTSAWVMPNEDGMQLCGARDLVDWDAREHAVVLRARALTSCVRDQLPTASKAVYMSGNLTSFRRFSQRYGIFEIETRLPDGKGMWPAFWLLPEGGGWPPEIDVLEQLGNDPAALARDPRGFRSSRVYHWGLVAGLAPMTRQRVEAGDYVRGLPDLTADYHRYAVDWGPETIAFYFDDRMIAVTATPETLKSVPMYWLAGLAIGGGWAGMPTDPVAASLYIKRIAVWQRAGYGDKP